MVSRPEPRPRSDFKHFTLITTRWADNDMYGHVNNVAYYAFFDTAVNRYLIEHGGIEPMTSPVIGLVVETACAYFQPLSYPENVEIGLIAARIGRSSVRYEIGIFAEGADSASAQGHFVHVYVDAKTRRPETLPAQLRAALGHIAV